MNPRRYSTSDLGNETFPVVNEPAGSRFNEVIFYSSSHLTERHGARKLIMRKLGNIADITIHARGGRTWDDQVTSDFCRTFESESQKAKLHIILLGDNDVRGDKIDEQTLPCIDKFCKSISELSQRIYERGDQIFIIGILPFQMIGKKFSCKQIENHFAVTNALVKVCKASPAVHFMPMRLKAMRFCSRNNMRLRGLFAKDNVHLSKLGETFLVELFHKQVRAFMANTNFGVLKSDLCAYRDSYNTKLCSYLYGYDNYIKYEFDHLHQLLKY